jgi:hypothetical protein
MHPSLQAWLTDTLLIAAYVGQDVYGTPTYGANVSVPARVERHFQTMASVTGGQLVEETIAYINGDAVVDERSRVTFSDGAIVPIEGVQPVKNTDGLIDHYKLFF